MADETKTTFELDINTITDIDEIKRLHNVLQKQEVRQTVAIFMFEFEFL